MAQDQILLTPHQRSVVTKGVAYLKEDNHRILLIQGSAGTGKTTLVHTLVSELSHELSAKKDRTYSVVMTAPTHKAVEVLRQKNSDEDNIYTEFCTLHSALRLKYSIDEDKGIEKYIPDPSIRERKLSGATILVIDEASMIGTDLLHYIDLSLEDNKLLKVIFIGDNKQLPPVNEPSYISPIFNQGYKQLGLTEIIRQAAENPIIPLSNNIYQLNSYTDKTTQEGLGYSFTKDTQKIIRYFVQNRHDTDIRFLAYTNKRVEEFNKLVRHEIYDRPSKIELGETIIIDRSYQVDRDIIFNNNEEVKINSSEVYEIDFEYPIDKEANTDSVPLKVYIVNGCLPIIHEDSEFLFLDILDQLKRKAKKKDLLWRDYYQTRNSFAVFKHRYALTIHKAQGSTYREVYLDYDDINKNPVSEEKKKLIYTAITRASKHLTVLTSRLKDGK